MRAVLYITKRYSIGRITSLIILLLALLVQFSCNSGNSNNGHIINPKDTIEINEGVITYSITYPNINKNKPSPFYPGEIKFVFKGNLSSYIIPSGLGTVKIVRLLNYEKKEFISLLIDTWGKNYACKETEEQILKKETSQKYEYEFMDETVVYDNLSCKKAKVKNFSSNTEFEIFYAPGIKVNNWNSPYVRLNKLLIEYPFQENGLDMILKAQKIEPKEIDSSFFNVKGSFTWVTSTQFNDHLKSLQK